MTKGKIALLELFKIPILYLHSVVKSYDFERKTHIFSWTQLYWQSSLIQKLSCLSFLTSIYV